MGSLQPLIDEVEAARRELYRLTLIGHKTRAESLAHEAAYKRWQNAQDRLREAVNSPRRGPVTSPYDTLFGQGQPSI